MHRLTPYQSQYVAWQLSRRMGADSADLLASTLVDAQVDLNPHQVEAALFAFRSPLSKGVILADEVGLGKTIEAGLVIAQRWAERKRRILIITPANLRKQWHQELQDKFSLQALILESSSHRQLKKDGHKFPFEQGSRVLICSYQFAKAKADELKSVPWDLVVMDEAHRLRNVYKPSNVIGKALKESLAHAPKAPRIKRLSEYIGQSYFEYLAALPDLVLLMDESHRYRASAGVRAINELKPLLGLELTATPFVETTKGPVAFKNVVVDYPLARAMEDGFVKEPAVVTQRNFDAKTMPPEEVERVKLQDGVRMHEATKVELKTYSRTQNVKEVKPFMLVIARDTTHAGDLLAYLQSDGFFAGRYRNKVIQVDSSKSGADEEDMIRRLLAVESVDEPTEIVIHVNMLKEGWDVTNLYTIVPLRAANARTLVEQSIGRGLRLPYGKRTGVDAVDRLSIIAHDRFQEIIDDANRSDSPIKLKTLILDAPDRENAGTRSVTVRSSRIKQMVFGGFSKCLYPQQKFDSDTERRFAVILERDANKWFKPAKGQFQMYYKLGAEQPEYVPDFVAETEHFVLMVETKARNELEAADVVAKAQAGAVWCKNASDHARSAGAKPWTYLLVPHEQVTEDKGIQDYLSFAKVARAQ